MKNIIVSAGASRLSGAKTIYLQMMEHLKDWVNDNHYYVFVDCVEPQLLHIVSERRVAA